ncbi:MAG: BTAD domain-containing putative transcriptional regulator, partial [Nitriliruptoraceae bacterium]
AVQLSLRLREVDDFDENAHRLLLTALSRLGAVTEAERAHEVFVAAMAELGLPAPELEAFG